MLLIFVFALLCITSVFCVVSKSGEDYNKNDKNVTTSTVQNLVSRENKTTTDSIGDQKLANIFNSIVEANVNNFVGAVRSFGEAELKSESRKSKKEPDLMSRILPMLIIPFMLQTAIIPMMLTMLKFMLLKSAFLGKMAILMGLLNLFRKSNDQGGVFTHNIFLEHEKMPEKLMENHYGYNAGDEYGAYTNRRRRTMR